MALEIIGPMPGRSNATSSEDGSVRVCEHCLKENAIDARLALHAKRLEAQAHETRALIGRLKVPTYEERLAEEERVDAARVAECEEPY
jgi:hypothetical protein